MIEYGVSAAHIQPEAEAVLPFACREIAHVNVRILGPEQMWGGDIRATGLNVSELQRLLNETGQRSGLRLAGYIIEEHGGTLRYHMSRLPRRVNLAVPEIGVFRNAFNELKTTLHESQVPFTASEEAASPDASFRVLMGLEEGYYEARRKDLLRQIDHGTIADMRQLREVFLQRLGDPSKFNLDLEESESLASARNAIASVSMSKLHSVQEVRDALTADFVVTPALIHSVAPDYIYIEPAVEITAPRSHTNFEAITLLAAQFHQARFSLEHLDLMEAFNVEVLEDSDNNAARFG